MDFPYVTISDAASITGFTADYIRKLIRENQVDAYKLTHDSPFLFLSLDAVELRMLQSQAWVLLNLHSISTAG